MHRRLAFLAMLVASFLVQTTLAPELSIAGVKPDFILVVTVCFAVFEGPGRGAAFGFWGGFLEDMVSNAVMGVSSLTKVVVGYLAGELKNRMVSSTVLLPVLVVFLFSVLNELLKFLVWVAIGWDGRPAFRFSVIAGMALYDALITVVVYPLVRRLVEHEEEVTLFK